MNEGESKYSLHVRLIKTGKHFSGISGLHLSRSKISVHRADSAGFVSFGRKLNILQVPIIIFRSTHTHLMQLHFEILKYSQVFPHVVV